MDKEKIAELSDMIMNVANEIGEDDKVLLHYGVVLSAIANAMLVDKNGEIGKHLVVATTEWMLALLISMETVLSCSDEEITQFLRMINYRNN